MKIEAFENLIRWLPVVKANAKEKLKVYTENLFYLRSGIERHGRFCGN